jgi:hypothetical protein
MHSNACEKHIHMTIACGGEILRYNQAAASAADIDQKSMLESVTNLESFLMSLIGGGDKRSGGRRAGVGDGVYNPARATSAGGRAAFIRAARERASERRQSV